MNEAAKAARSRRLGEALRANLRRRKEAAARSPVIDDAGLEREAKDDAVPKLSDERAPSATSDKD